MNWICVVWLIAITALSIYNTLIIIATAEAVKVTMESNLDFAKAVKKALNRK